MSRLLPALLVVAACAHPKPVQPFTNLMPLPHGADVFPNAAAVVLFARDQVRLGSDGAGEFYIQTTTHRIYSIASEAAFDLANLRVVVPPYSELVSLSARHRRPGGPVEDLDEKDLIVDESPGEAGTTASARFFRFSGVGVGSVLEWSYVLHTSRFAGFGELRPPADYPVLEYDGWVEAPLELEIAARGYNGSEPVAIAPEDGWVRWQFRASNVPASDDDEQLLPDPSFTSPALAWRVASWSPKYGGQVLARIPMLAGWNDVFAWWAYLTYTSQQAVMRGLSFELGGHGCGDKVACVVEHAVGLVNRSTAYVGVGDWLPDRRAVEVLASREATGFERMLLIKRLLDTQRIISKVGGYTAPYTHRVDDAFPSLEQLNRPILYLPAQRGLATPMWVDPACPSCGPGRVGTEADGARATLVDLHGVDRYGRPQVRTYPQQVLAPRFRGAGRTETISARVWPNGDVGLSFRDERYGRTAVEQCSKSPKERGPPDVVHLVATAELRQHDDLQCEPDRSIDVFRALLPDHAVEDGAALYVPLTAMAGEWSRLLAPRQRTQPIAFTELEWRTYHFEVTVPDGWKLEAGQSRDEAQAGPGLKARVEVKPTPAGADVVLSVEVTPGLYAPQRYADVRKVAEFVRGVRSRALKFVKR